MSAGDVGLKPDQLIAMRGDMRDTDLIAAVEQFNQLSSPARMLRWHEALAWLGSLLVLVHAGVHFNAILGWLAVWAMLINVGSGLTGKFLLDRSRRRMEEARQRLRARGLPEAELEDQLY